MLKKYSIKKQFISTFFLALIFSLISFVILFLIFMYILNSNMLYPANYYERQIPKIEDYIMKCGDNILNETEKGNLENIIPTEGIKYKVYNLKNKSSYGNLQIKDEDNNSILKKLNTVDINAFNNVTKVVPIISNNGTLEGVVYLNYNLKASINPHKKLIGTVLGVVTLLSPFIFIIIYSIIFGRKLSKNLNEPFKQLIEASNKIQVQDLDFKLNYPYDNEIGKLMKSFESMRVELDKTLTKQWETEKEKTDMINALSHDLRTPLTVIKGHVELLQDGSYKNEERLLRYLNSMENSVNRAVLLVEDLNLLSKLENPDFTLQVEQINVKSFLEDKIEEYIPFSNKKNIKLSLNEINIDANTTFFLDRLRISQVLDNIITNGLRFSPEGGKIQIDVEYEKENLFFKVCDSGEGFNEEDLKNIFTKFYRGDKSRRKSTGNSGLGLYISKSLVEKHNGNIKAYNSEDSGAIIEFFIKNP
ncbi:HAMP domain-containing sensor histidine kinase [Clostridium senegalense]|uniref:histidine kinase n=1 Tax=Clostridium senegalense TaxID=1465809 RepID=A0A6M0H3D4_9CLOT|nr:HAMP domain-containing sensor histidine kinase [Clostridium senegalense]NEU05225.1 HAMP domain-containing histidine kinase [Clostridium senegalense]